MSAVTAAGGFDWSARLEFQPTAVLLHILAMDDGVAPPPMKSKCVELLALRNGSPSSEQVVAPASLPAAADVRAPAGDPPPPVAVAASEAQPPKRYDIRISESEILTGLTSEQLVRGLQEGWLIGSDRWETSGASKTLREAFYHVKPLRLHFDREPTLSNLCGAWAAKITFAATVYLQIVGPLVRYGELAEGLATQVGILFLLWMTAVYATGKAPKARSVVVIGGIFLSGFLEGASFRSVLASLLLHPTTILVILGSTFSAFVVFAVAASYLDGRIKLKVDRKEVPDGVRTTKMDGMGAAGAHR